MPKTDVERQRESRARKQVARMTIKDLKAAIVEGVDCKVVALPNGELKVEWIVTPITLAAIDAVATERGITREQFFSESENRVKVQIQQRN